MSLHFDEVLLAFFRWLYHPQSAVILPSSDLAYTRTDRSRLYIFNSKCDLERIVIYYVINNFLLTEREVFTEKYRTEVRYFSVKTKQARLIKSL
jgi:hypothetical protein